MKLFNILVYIEIGVLVATEVYCIYWLWNYFKEHCREKKRQRRQYYRQKAYAEMEERYKLYQVRQELFDSIAGNS